MNRFLQEIAEQPRVIEKLLSFYGSSEGEKLLENVKRIVEKSPGIQIIFTGMGSSYFISQAASTLFNNLGFNSTAINASELIHYNLPLLNRPCLLISISQSGESFETKEIFPRLSTGITCIGIVNEEKSTLALKSDISLPALAGREEMTSTKTYIATTLVSFILGWYLSGCWNEDKKSMISHLAGVYKRYLGNYESEISKAISFLGDLSTLQIIARGPSFSTASQSALMFKEALHIPATGIIGGEFRHGPMEMVSEGFRAILFSSPGTTFSQSMKMASDIASFGGKVIVITNNRSSVIHSNILEIIVDEADEYLFSAASILPVQLFVDMYAKSKGFSAGSFSRGAKVTETE